MALPDDVDFVPYTFTSVPRKTSLKVGTPPVSLEDTWSTVSYDEPYAFVVETRWKASFTAALVSSYVVSPERKASM